MDYPVEYLSEMREYKDDEFKNSPYSPLTPEQQKLFDGLSYFEPNPELEFNVTPIEFESKDMVRILTTQNEIRHYQRWGKVEFVVDDQPVSLTLYLPPGEARFFVPFTDATTGDESYSAGRYVELETNEEDVTVRLDFNEAYSPYCAYNEPPELAEQAGREPRVWNCPLVPAENRLNVAIRAGEKTPTGSWIISEH